MFVLSRCLDGTEAVLRGVVNVSVTSPGRVRRRLVAGGGFCRGDGIGSAWLRTIRRIVACAAGVPGGDAGVARSLGIAEIRC